VDFYVYVHKRATDGTVFYVGKGKGKRFTNAKNRNNHWRNIVNKHGFTAHIVMRFNNEECAFSLEKALIKHYGRSNLCNLTDGGEGLSGMEFSDSHKSKISAANKGKPKTAEHVAKSSNAQRGKVISAEHREKLSIACKGRTLSKDHRDKIGVSCKGMIRSQYMKDKMSLSAMSRSRDSIDKMIASKVVPKTYTFWHEDGHVFVGTQLDLRSRYGLHQANLSSVINGRRVSCGGWRLIVDVEKKT